MWSLNTPHSIIRIFSANRFRNDNFLFLPLKFFLLFTSNKVVCCLTDVKQIAVIVQGKA